MPSPSNKPTSRVIAGTEKKDLDLAKEERRCFRCLFGDGGRKCTLRACAHREGDDKKGYGAENDGALKDVKKVISKHFSCLRGRTWVRRSIAVKSPRRGGQSRQIY